MPSNNSSDNALAKGQNIRFFFFFIGGAEGRTAPSCGAGVLKPVIFTAGVSSRATPGVAEAPMVSCEGSVDKGSAARCLKDEVE